MGCPSFMVEEICSLVKSVPGVYAGMITALPWKQYPELNYLTNERGSAIGCTNYLIAVYHGQFSIIVFTQEFLESLLPDQENKEYKLQQECQDFQGGEH